MIEKRGFDDGCVSCGFICGCSIFHRKFTCLETDGSYIHNIYRRWLLVLLILFMFDCYYIVVVYYKALRIANRKLNFVDMSAREPNVTRKSSLVYKYPLNNSMEITMDFKNAYNSSYHWFTSMKHLFKNLGDEETLHYPKDTPNCQLNESSLGPITVNKTEPELAWVEAQNPEVRLGGYYAPAHCRAIQRVAIIVPYRDRRANLPVLLRYLHPFLKKQQLEYRIFVIEQYGAEQFNKGTLYNIAYLETQRFGTWHCLIFHDVDLIPEDERISYTCLEYPTHMSPAVEAHGYVLPYNTLFGGVTSFTPQQYEIVNGYSNFYWSWGAEDDDMYIRLQCASLLVLRYNESIARYTSLPHERSLYGEHRRFFLHNSKVRYQKEGLVSTKYNLIRVTKDKMFTHIVANVNPVRMKLDLKRMLRQIVYLFDNSMTYAGVEVVKRGENGM